MGGEEKREENWEEEKGEEMREGGDWERREKRVGGRDGKREGKKYIDFHNNISRITHWFIHKYSSWDLTVL